MEQAQAHLLGRQSRERATQRFGVAGLDRAQEQRTAIVRRERFGFCARRCGGRRTLVAARRSRRRTVTGGRRTGIGISPA